MAAPLYLLLVLLPSILGQCTVKHATPQFSRSVYEFSVDLIQRLSHETENHFVASPISLWTLLSSVSVGADGTTLDEINKTLRRNPVKCFNKRYLDIVKEITANTGDTTLERSSTVFIDQAMPVHEKYQRKLTKTGVCDIQIMPFENFQTVATTINDYVSRVTHDTIQEVVSASDIEGVFLILIDAIYFKGAWRHPFDPSRTVQGDNFYDESGNHAGYVSMMRGMVSVKTGLFPQIQAKVLQLPYGEQNRFSMLIFLPYANSTVTTVTDHLKHVSFQSIYNGLDLYPEDTVDVRLPRFKINSDLDNLKELLMDMGLRTMFDSTHAEFPFISAYELYVSDVLQKAQIEVTEEGTVASAAGAAEMQSRNLPEQFIVNKPFLFMIMDMEFRLPLFTGAYSKPSTF